MREPMLLEMIGKIPVRVSASIVETVATVVPGRSAGSHDGKTVERRSQAPDGPPDDGTEWEVDAPVDDGECLGVGDGVTFSKTLCEGDVRRFATASGDTNPVHMDDEYADRTRFDDRIAHGLLVAGTISAALARLPGTVVYLSQDLSFQAPVYLGDRVTAEVEVVEALGADRYRLRTSVENGDETAIDGDATVLLSA